MSSRKQAAFKNLRATGSTFRPAWAFTVCLLLTIQGCIDLTPKTTATKSSEQKSAIEAVPAEPAQKRSKTWDVAIGSVIEGKSPRLHIDDGSIDANDLADLQQLEEGQLLDLLIDQGNVSDAAMLLIGKLKGLEHLRIRLSPITDEGLANLVAGSNDSLRILNLPQAEITAKGIGLLESLPNLIQLRLSGQQLDDAAMTALAQLPNLKMLHLIGPAISADGLIKLAEAPQLTSLYIDDCEVSDEGWGKLFEAKPGLHVHIDQLHHDRDPHKH